MLGNMTPEPQHAMLPYLVDLESPFDPETPREYAPAELVRFALTLGNYWAGLALTWLQQGVSAAGLLDELRAFESETHRPQAQRHQARRLWKQLN